MNRHDTFLQKHKDFIEMVQMYALMNKLDYALVLGDKDDIILPWKVLFPQNIEILSHVLGELNENMSGTIHCEHHTSLEEYSRREKELRAEGADGIISHDPVVKH